MKKVCASCWSLAKVRSGNVYLIDTGNKKMIFGQGATHEKFSGNTPRPPILL